MKLVARTVAVQRGARAILTSVDLGLAPGELVLLAGRNGAGKSTLLRVLLGAETPARGEVSLGDRPVTAWPPQRRATEVAFVPQAADCPFEFTGRELVAMGRHPHRARLAPETASDRAAIERALDAVDAVAFADRAVTTLSGGELRRIAVARALATEAPLLLLDEPTTNLDLEHAIGLARLLRRLADAGRGLLVAAHDLNLLAPYAHRVALLHGGRIHAEGTPRNVLDAANVATVFGVAAGPPTDYFPRAFEALEP